MEFAGGLTPIGIKRLAQLWIILFVFIVALKCSHTIEIPLNETKKLSVIPNGMVNWTLPNEDHYAYVCMKPSRPTGNDKKPKKSCWKFFVSNASQELFTAVHENGEVQLHCPTSLGDSTVSWTNESGSVLNKDKTNLMLRIKKFTKENEGRYQCEVTQDEKKYIGVTFRLKIGKEPKACPSLDVKVKKGDSETIVCNSEVNQEDLKYPQMKEYKLWTKNFEEVDREKYIISNGSLYFKEINPDDTGEYHCMISNHFGKSYLTLNLEVVTGVITYTAKEGCELKLVCSLGASANWVLPHTTDKNKQEISTDEKCGLSFYKKFPVRKEHAGRYRCDYMSDSQYFDVKVVGAHE